MDTYGIEKREFDKYIVPSALFSILSHFLERLSEDASEAHKRIMISP